MRSNKEYQQPVNPEDTPESSAKVSATVNGHSVTAMRVTDQNCAQETITCDPKGEDELFEERYFITMSDSLPEMDIIFENEYVM